MEFLMDFKLPLVMGRTITITAAHGPKHVQLQVSGAGSKKRDTFVTDLQEHEDIDKVELFKSPDTRYTFSVHVYPKKDRYPSIAQIAHSFLTKTVKTKVVNPAPVT